MWGCEYGKEYREIRNRYMRWLHEGWRWWTVFEGLLDVAASKNNKNCRWNYSENRSSMAKLNDR